MHRDIHLCADTHQAFWHQQNLRENGEFASNRAVGE